MNKPTITDSVILGLRSIGIKQNKKISIKEGLKRGYVDVKNGKYIMTSKGEKARIQNIQEVA